MLGARRLDQKARECALGTAASLGEYLLGQPRVSARPVSPTSVWKGWLVALDLLL